MNPRLLTLAYRVFPLIPGAYAVGMYLMPKALPRRTLSIIGLLIAGAMIAAATLWTRSALSGVAVGRLVAAWSLLYGLPMFGLVIVATLLPRSLDSRLVGAVVLAGSAVFLHFLGRLLSGTMLNLVNASG